MTISGIISISGKAGLYKVIAQGKNNIIVESLLDNKRFPAYATDRISALEDISIYTYSEDKPLSEIFDAIYEKEDKGTCISHKEKPEDIAAYLSEILPDYDQERVYPSDIKKIFQWYNLLHKAGELGKTEKEETVESEEEVKSAQSENAAKKEEKPKAKAKPKAKPTTAKPKAPAKGKSAPKASSAKKVATPKGGSSRGK